MNQLKHLFENTLPKMHSEMLNPDTNTTDEMIDCEICDGQGEHDQTAICDVTGSATTGPMMDCSHCGSRGEVYNDDFIDIE